MSRSLEETPGGVEAQGRAPIHAPRSALLWSYGLTIGRFGVTAVVTVVMASFLDPRTYGVMALAMVWVGFAQMLTLHGPAQAVIQRHEVSARHFDAAFWTTMIGAVALAAIFAGAAPLWARVNGTSELVYVCWALAPAIVLNGLVASPMRYSVASSGLRRCRCARCWQALSAAPQASRRRLPASVSGPWSCNR